MLNIIKLCFCLKLSYTFFLPTLPLIHCLPGPSEGVTVWMKSTAEGAVLTALASATLLTKLLCS